MMSPTWVPLTSDILAQKFQRAHFPLQGQSVDTASLLLHVKARTVELGTPNLGFPLSLTQSVRHLYLEPISYASWDGARNSP